MKRFLFAAAFLFIFTIGPKAQNPIAGPKSNFVWNQAATILSDAQGYTYRYYLDSASAATFVGVTCTGVASPFTCSVLVPTMTQGNHTITFTATSAAGESPQSVPFVFAFVANPPPAPSNIRITP